MNKFIRGSVWWCNSPLAKKDSHILLKRRPVVIVSNDIQNEKGNLLTVVPFSRTNNYPSLHPTFDFRSVGQCVTNLYPEQIKTVDKTELTEFIGIMSEEEIAVVNEYIMRHLGIDVSQNPSEEAAIVNPEPEESEQEITPDYLYSGESKDEESDSFVKPALSQIDKFNKKYGLGEYAPKKEPEVERKHRTHWSNELRIEFIKDYDSQTMTKEELSKKYDIKQTGLGSRASKIRKLLTEKGVI